MILFRLDVIGTVGGSRIQVRSLVVSVVSARLLARAGSLFRCWRVRFWVHMSDRKTG